MNIETYIDIYNYLIENIPNFSAKDAIKLIEKKGFNKDIFKEKLILFLENSENHENSEFIEAGLYLIEALCLTENWYDLLGKILLSVNHHEHENIIATFQEYQNEKSIPYIDKAIKLKSKIESLDYDDYGGFYKKCFWALVAIGTNEAKTIIEKYAESDDKQLREQAIYRLQTFEDDRNWSKQKSGKA